MPLFDGQLYTLEIERFKSLGLAFTMGISGLKCKTYRQMTVLACLWVEGHYPI